MGSILPHRTTFSAVARVLRQFQTPVPPVCEPPINVLGIWEAERTFGIGYKRARRPFSRILIGGWSPRNISPYSLVPTARILSHQSTRNSWHTVRITQRLSGFEVRGNLLYRAIESTPNPALLKRL